MLAEERPIRVRELIGWELDDNEFRPASLKRSDRIDAAHADIQSRACFQAIDPVEKHVPAPVASLFADQALRSELQLEMAGLDWSLRVVDLRRLLAFQRRLLFDPDYPRASAAEPRDWASLFHLSFGTPQSTSCTTLVSTPTELVLESANPNLHLRPTAAGSSSPFELHGGSPFFEVAQYGGRWFLRDGYHRAERLLRQGIYQVPAVIIQARSLAELGAVGPWFFSEQILFGPHPPLVTDFLLDELIQEYTRPRMLKTLRINIEESFGPAPTDAHPGEQP